MFEISFGWKHSASKNAEVDGGISLLITVQMEIRLKDGFL